MKFLSRDDILSVDDLPFKDVPVPEWQGTVRVRTLRGVDRANLVASISVSKDGAPSDWIERMVAACAIDENGNQLFTENDIAEISKKNSRAIQRLFDAADALNTITSEKEEVLKGGIKARPEILFYFRLAKELGMTVSRLLTDLDSNEIAGWKVYFEIEVELEKEKTETAKQKKAAGEAAMLRAKLDQSGKIAATKKKKHGKSKI